MSTAFKDYITSAHQGMDDADLAYRKGHRDDKHGTPHARERQTRLQGSGRGSGARSN